MKKFLKMSGCLYFMIFLCVLMPLVFPKPCPASGSAKNVIILIADGCGAEQYTFARWFKGAPLSVDGIHTGSVKTYIADSVVADSAPAASAFATGVRTFDKVISVGSPPMTSSAAFPASAKKGSLRPFATILEGAKMIGKSTGLVSTSRVSHATPAAFAAHVPSRRQEDDIMEQMVFQDIDVVFGGGMGRLLPAAEGGRRADGDNLLSVLKDRGVHIVTDSAGMAAVHDGRVYGLFSGSHMAAEIDRPMLGPSQPSLKEMTEKAIEILSRDTDGFFLMVEGSQIDWACHANDPAHLTKDLLAFDEAVAAGLAFAKKDGKTLLVVMSDHNTGGFSIGNYKTNGTYSQMKPEELLGPVRKMTVSAMVLWQMTKADETVENIIRSVKNGWGMEITKEDAGALLAKANQYKNFKAAHYAFGEILCPKYTNIGWSTHGHTGGDVPLYAYGPGKPSGVVDAPELGRICAAALGVDLEEATRRLYQDARAVLPGARVTIDRTDANNPVAKIVLANREFAFPANRNRMIENSKVTLLEAPVVIMEADDSVYIPMKAVSLMNPHLSRLPEAGANPS